jgi:hypothetical protein
METIRGRRSLDLDWNGLRERLAHYHHIHLDLGTGDGRYARCLAARNPGWFIIGVDSCRENLYEHSRAKLSNLLFVIASAQDLPRELNGLVSHVSINFPWGSLLTSLLTNDPSLMCGFESIARPTTCVDLRLNGGALAEAGWELESGAGQIHQNLLRAGWQVQAPARMAAADLRSFPSTWAKRLAFGRDPRAIWISGKLSRQPYRMERQAVFSL